MKNSDKFQLLVAAAAADGTIDNDEMQQLRALAARLDLSFEEIQAIIDDVQVNKRVVVQRPENPEERDALYDDLISLVLADGQITRGEARILEHVAKKFGYSSDYVRGLLRGALMFINRG